MLVGDGKNLLLGGGGESTEKNSNWWKGRGERKEQLFVWWEGLPPIFPVAKTLDSTHQPYLIFSVTFFLEVFVIFFHEGLILVCLFYLGFCCFVILPLFPQSLLNCQCCFYTISPLGLVLVLLLSLLL